MEIILQNDPDSASQVAARLIARRIKEKPDAVLGLATGSTPLALYRELIRLHQQEGLDFSKVTTFNLDEYIGLGPDHPQSYHFYMQKNFFSQVNVAPERIHIPDGITSDVSGFCSAYEEQIRESGGIDLQILGIGSDGHVGFNEPTSSLASRTRIKTLTPETLADNARFFERSEDQPHHVITMGIGTILDARQVVMLAFGEQKAEAVVGMVEGPITAELPASALQFHTRTHVFLDEGAGRNLKRKDYYRWVYENKPDWQKH